MEQRGASAGALGASGRVLVPEPYDSFMRSHLSYYGYFQGPQTPVSLGSLSELHPAEGPGRGSTCSSCRGGPRQKLSSSGRGTPVPSVRPRACPAEPRTLFALPSAQAPLPPPRWPIECEVIEETIEHVEWVPPEPEPFCPPAGPGLGQEQGASEEQCASEEQGTVVYHLNPAPQGSCFTRARVGGAPGPLSSPAAPLEGPQDTTLIFESRFESGNLQKAVKVGPYEYVLTLRPDLYTAKHTQWFYFRVQNTRRDPLYRFTIANLAKPKSLYGQGLRPLLYSQRDARSRGIGWRRVGDDVRYYRAGAGGEGPAAFRLSWSSRFPHDGDTCFFAHSYPYTYSDLRRYLRALAGDPARSRYCAVRALCRSLAGNTVYLLTVTGDGGGGAAKRAVVLSARAHPGESGGSWAMRGFLDFLLSSHPDARLLRRLFVFVVVPMLNPDGVVVGNSRCSLAGRDPNRAYGAASRGSFPAVWHLRATVERVLAEREVVLYCDFHGHSRKNNVFMYGCDGGGGAGARLCQRIFPLMLSKNAPDKFSFPSCKFQVQKSKEGTGRVVMWRLGVSNSYTLEVAFGGSTLGGRSSHFTLEDLKSLGYHLCDTLLDFCDPDPAKLRCCLSELDTVLRRRLGREPGPAGGWSDVSPSDLESSTSGSDSSVSDGPPAHLCAPTRPVRPRVPPLSGQEGRSSGEVPQGAGAPAPPCRPARPEQRRRKRLRSRRARNTLRQARASSRSRAGVPARPGTLRLQQPTALPGTQRGGGVAGEEPGAGSGVTLPSVAAQPDGATDTVPRRQPRPSTGPPGRTGNPLQELAPRAGPRPCPQRGGRAGTASGHGARAPLATPAGPSPPAAVRCCACARH